MQKERIREKVQQTEREIKPRWRTPLQLLAGLEMLGQLAVRQGQIYLILVNNWPLNPKQTMQ